MPSETNAADGPFSAGWYAVDTADADLGVKWKRVLGSNPIRPLAFYLQPRARQRGLGQPFGLTREFGQHSLSHTCRRIPRSGVRRFYPFR